MQPQPGMPPQYDPSGQPMMGGAPPAYGAPQPGFEMQQPMMVPSQPAMGVGVAPVMGGPQTTVHIVRKDSDDGYEKKIRKKYENGGVCRYNEPCLIGMLMNCIFGMIWLLILMLICLCLCG